MGSLHCILFLGEGKEWRTNALPYLLCVSVTFDLKAEEHYEG